MVQFIKIGGTNHPVSFSVFVQVLYQRNFKRSMAGDTQRFAVAMQALTTGDLSSQFVEELVNIAYVGIENGYQSKDQPMPLSYKELADALLNDANAITQITVAYIESLPNPNAEEKKGKPGAAPAKSKMKGLKVG